MTTEKTMQRNLAQYLLTENRMVVEPTSDMMQRFPLKIFDSEDTETAWLEAAAELLKGAVELRYPYLPSGKLKLVVKDRGVLFTQAEAEAMEEMAKNRKALIEGL